MRSFEPQQLIFKLFLVTVTFSKFLYNQLSSSQQPQWTKISLFRTFERYSKTQWFCGLGVWVIWYIIHLLISIIITISQRYYSIWVILYIGFGSRKHIVPGSEIDWGSKMNSLSVFVLGSDSFLKQHFE